MFKTVKNVTNLAIESLKLRSTDSDLLKNKSVDAILNLLAGEKGIALKIAQVLGSNSDNLSELSEVAKGVNLTAIPLEEIKTEIESSLGNAVNELFDEIEEAKWVASLGQIHPCTLKGKLGNYVIKVQYPGIQEKIQDQLKLMGLFGKLGGKTRLRKWGFDIGDYLDNFDLSLKNEMNYLHELKNLKKFNQFNLNRNILSPEPVEVLARENILVTRMMPGVSIDEFVQSSSIGEKKRIAEDLLMVYMEQLLFDGFIQGDTHKGNFYIHNCKLVFLDFGHFITLTETEVNALQNLLQQIVDGQIVNPLGILKDVGFDLEKLRSIEDSIPLILENLFKPFIYNQTFDLKTWDAKADIDKIIGEQRWWFRSSGNARFFQLLRSFLGPYLIIKDLGIPINWHQCAKEVLSKLNIVDEIELIEPLNISPTAKNLRIEVFRDGNKTVDLFLPARSTMNLESLLDDKVKASIESKGYDIKHIKEHAMACNLAPMILFELEEDEKKYRVFLA
ncbi:MAG: putative unusual protein kinase regulating ubiquinone biosynthesis (AarF/ABC1/UbiB family) [Bacteriovoracaceae bacterium]|jgi:predicted unusual protein kinase regulating ubiquinone biosynthesis (AarF/ABC1/UbiB family)